MKCCEQLTSLSTRSTSESEQMGNQQFIKDDVQSNQDAETRGINRKKELVKQKLLKAFPKLRDKNELQEKAGVLCDSKLIEQTYFGHLLRRRDIAAETIQEEADTFQGGFRNRESLHGSVRNMMTEINQVQQLEVKLVLYELSDKDLKNTVARYIHSTVHSFDFGPFHAAIQIGDTVIDWGPKSLIIPFKVSPAHDEDPHCRSPILVTNLHEEPTLETSLMSGIEPQSSPEAIQEGFQKVHTILHTISEEKECLIDELAKLVVRYNTKFYYGLFSNNCHHFVFDVLTVLGITDHREAFKGKIRDYAEILTASDKKKMTEFNSHADLNTHVQEKIETMSRDYLEWAYSHYLLFHAWSKKMPNEDAWRCDPESCMCTAVYKKLEPQG